MPSFPRGRRLFLGYPFWLVLPSTACLLAASPSPAQQARRPPPAASTPREEEQEKAPAASPDAAPADEPPQIFGDPKKINQFSGWGGVGGAMGQFGFARSMLIMMPAVQEELGLSEDQKTELRDWAQVMRDRGEEMTKGIREDAEAAAREGNPPTNIFGMLNVMQALMSENEKGIGEILSPDQRKRLQQISLQMEGITALARPEVAQAVRLHPHQIEQVQQLLAQARTRQIFHFMDQGRRMWAEQRARRAQGEEKAGDDPDKPRPPASPRSRLSRDNDPRDRPSDGDAAESKPVEKPKDSPRPKKADDDDDDDDESESPEEIAARKAEREKREKEARQRFDQMRSGADQIQDETVRLILKVLTSGQRTRYEKLLGPPFDPESALRGLGPDSRSRRPGAGSPPPVNPPVPDPETP